MFITELAIYNLPSICSNVVLISVLFYGRMPRITIFGIHKLLLQIKDQPFIYLG
jgi:hypothetical protein